MTLPDDTDDPTGDILDAIIAGLLRDLEGAVDRPAMVDRCCALHPEHDIEIRKTIATMSLVGATRSEADGQLPGRFGDFRVVRRLARGGMGEIFEAVQEPLGRRVAVKTIRDDQFAASPEVRARFLREQTVLARLHHTHIVPIHAAGREGHLHYFAMPYIEGAALSHVVESARTLRSLNGSTPTLAELAVQISTAQANHATRPTPDAVAPPPGASPPAPLALSAAYFRSVARVLADAADAVQHAHDAHVLHRDLKPSNLMVDRHEHCWVVDFGLARDHNGHPPDAPLPAEADAATSGRMGTELYMAPEQYELRADERTDVWGLGATLYELLTLRRAFASPSQVQQADPAPPRSLVPNLPRDLEAICLKALHKDPARRYPSARALADDLRRWLNYVPVSARPAHAPRRAALWGRRNKGWAAAIALALFGSMGLGIYAEEQRQRAVEREQARGRQLRLLEIQSIPQGDRRPGWSDEMWKRLTSVKWEPEERGVVQAQAVASLTGLDVHTDKEFRSFAPTVAFAPDGRLWLAAADEGPVRWDPETGRREAWGPGIGGPLAIHPDGSARQLGPTYTDPDRPGRIPIDSRPNPRFPLQVLDVERRQVARTLADPIEGGSRLLAWALAPRASHAAAAVADPQGRQVLLVWDAEAGRLLHRIATRKAPESPALPRVGLAFSPDSDVLASWDGSGRVGLWSPSDGRAVASFTGRNPVHCVAFGPNRWRREEAGSAAGRWLLAVGDANGLTTLWNPGAEGAWHVLQGQGSEILSLAFSPDGTLVAAAGRRDGVLWDVATGRHLVGFGSGDYTSALAFSPDGTRLASSGYHPFGRPEDRAHSRIFRLEPSRGIRQLHGLPAAAVRVACSRDGRRVAALSSDWWAGVWERDTGRLLRLLAVPRGQWADNAALAFSPEGRQLAVSAGKTATLWDLETGAERRWDLPWALTEALAFAGPDRLMLMRTEVRDGSRPPDSEAPAADYPRVCVLRNLLGGTPEEPVKVVTEFAWGVKGIDAAPDGSCFVIEGRTGPPLPAATRSVKVYDPDGRLLTDLPTQWPSDDPDSGLCFDPGGKLLALWTHPTGRSDLFEMPNGRFLGPAPVAARGVAPGARLWAELQLIDGPERLRLHDRAGRVLIAEVTREISSIDIPFSPDRDGRSLLWGNRSGLVGVADLAEVQGRLARIGLGW